MKPIRALNILNGKMDPSDIFQQAVKWEAIREGYFERYGLSAAAADARERAAEYMRGWHRYNAQQS